MDEFTRECLAIVVARRLTVDDVLAPLTDLFITRGCPDHLRSDNDPEFCAKVVWEWFVWLEVRTLFIEPGSHWENGYSESFNEKLRMSSWIGRSSARCGRRVHDKFVRPPS